MRKYGFLAMISLLLLSASCSYKVENSKKFSIKKATIRITSGQNYYELLTGGHFHVFRVYVPDTTIAVDNSIKWPLLQVNETESCMDKHLPCWLKSVTILVPNPDVKKSWETVIAEKEKEQKEWIKTSLIPE